MPWSWCFSPSSTNNSSAANLASPTMPTAGGYLSLIFRESISIRINSPFKGIGPLRPSVSDNSVPIARITSALARKSCTSGWIRLAPIHNGCVSGTTPLPAVVVNTAASRHSAILVRTDDVETAPPPTYINGRFACRNIAADLRISNRFGAGRAGPTRFCQRLVTGLANTSMGIAIWTGRGRSDENIENA